MAAYGKGEFYYGSDFSDFSGDDEFWDESPGSDDDGDTLCYCTCGLPATTDIASDADGCKTEWFHYECVGISANTVPEDSWFCDLCRSAMNNGKAWKHFFSHFIHHWNNLPVYESVIFNNHRMCVIGNTFSYALFWWPTGHGGRQALA